VTDRGDRGGGGGGSGDTLATAGAVVCATMEAE
jgi:hypothetical protein